MFVMLKIVFLTFQSVDNQCFLILFKMVTIGKKHLYIVIIRRRGSVINLDPFPL